MIILEILNIFVSGAATELYSATKISKPKLALQTALSDSEEPREVKSSPIDSPFSTPINTPNKNKRPAASIESPVPSKRLKRDEAARKIILEIIQVMENNQSYNIQVVKRKDNISPHAELSKEDKNVATINFLSELWDIVAHDKPVERRRTEEVLKAYAISHRDYQNGERRSMGTLRRNVTLSPLGHGTHLLIPECAVTCARSMIQMQSRVRQVVEAPPGTEDERLLCSREFCHEAHP
ncbi:hypothetical protein ASPFODRAFT_37063 [Aspergillus luchuensis CBS 106.47]|uniref:Uncharacterized protein n=1 Tax=Aspergillus luchuensis (strain CBS 106.47) TaxID=1137211 RepID=A0A1M3T584_ASPLC|nr:hypothetical protein ASPFODRAFT_37063 [Aspergillus luchuensis CBS 106.47]